MKSPKHSGGLPGWPGSFFFPPCWGGFQVPLLPPLCRLLAKKTQTGVSAGSFSSSSSLGPLPTSAPAGSMTASPSDSSRREWTLCLPHCSLRLWCCFLFSLSPSSPTHWSGLLQLIPAGIACRQIGWGPPSHSSRRQIEAFSRSPEMVMRRSFRGDCLLKSRATLAFV